MRGQVAFFKPGSAEFLPRTLVPTDISEQMVGLEFPFLTEQTSRDHILPRFDIEEVNPQPQRTDATVYLNTVTISNVLKWNGLNEAGDYWVRLTADAEFAADGGRPTHEMALAEARRLSEEEHPIFAHGTAMNGTYLEGAVAVDLADGTNISDDEMLTAASRIVEFNPHHAVRVVEFVERYAGSGINFYVMEKYQKGVISGGLLDALAGASQTNRTVGAMIYRLFDIEIGVSEDIRDRLRAKGAPHPDYYESPD